VKIDQTQPAPAGALVFDTSSGYTTVTDFYHEQQTQTGAIGVIIDGVRTTAAQYQRNNVVQNLDVQPSSATHVQLSCTGNSGNTLHNKVLTTKRQVANQQTIIVDSGVDQTKLELYGGNDSVAWGTASTDEVKDAGTNTVLNGITQIAPAAIQGVVPTWSSHGVNIGDIVQVSDDDNRTYLLDKDQAGIQISSEVCIERFAEWVEDGATTAVVLGQLPALAIIHDVRIIVEVGDEFDAADQIRIGTDANNQGVVTNFALDTAGHYSMLTGLDGSLGDGSLTGAPIAAASVIKAYRNVGGGGFDGSTSGKALVVVEWTRLPAKP
jgi:hypothetical protein